MIQWSDGRTALQREVGPNDKALPTLTTKVPSVPGHYILELDMVEEGIT